MTISNLPPPDELADIRSKIKSLEEREGVIKQLILANPDVRMGANWLAEVKEIETSRVDIKELRAMHKDLVEEYTFPTKATRIELSAIDAETGELMLLRIPHWPGCW
jgi:predicted phage-related endonuclease